VIVTPPLSLTAYAQRRGVSKMTISTAIKSGRLSKSVVRTGKGQPKIADPELADEELDATTDHSKAPAYVKERESARAGAAGGSLAEASAEEKRWKAARAKLEYERRAGELVEIAEVEKQMRDVIAACKGKILGIPSKLRQMFPDFTHEHLVKLDDLLREALEELADAGAAKEAA